MAANLSLVTWPLGLLTERHAELLKAGKAD